jgi:hypothetical protein
LERSFKILLYSASVRRRFTVVASIVLARSTAVLHAGEATGATVVVLELGDPEVTVGLGVGDETPSTPASAPTGRSSDQATAPTTTPPTRARTTSRPASSNQRLEGCSGSGSGAGDGWAASAWAPSRRS